MRHKTHKCSMAANCQMHDGKPCKGTEICFKPIAKPKTAYIVFDNDMPLVAFTDENKALEEAKKRASENTDGCFHLFHIHSVPLNN